MAFAIHVTFYIAIEAEYVQRVSLRAIRFATKRFVFFFEISQNKLLKLFRGREKYFKIYYHIPCVMPHILKKKIEIAFIHQHEMRKMSNS